MKIYTKTGDKGTTSLLYGTRVSKSDARLEAYGTCDELNSYLGLVKDQESCKEEYDIFNRIQSFIFTLGSHLATEKEDTKGFLTPLKEEELKFLESEIDKMDEKIEPLKNFILPGGHPAVSVIHIARTVCRRAERRVVDLKSLEVEVNPLLIEYLNRLSDFLFVYARFVSKKQNVEEVPWKTN
ncbi:MAG: cob(I)yrinic acid a,c-diamide adenosyltransferase [Cyclobacteriaceae bacterium]|nr:cob(I)yrinic acid a,c-diamide adenosyltransferase [Cyclobacteriaceae bacterium]MCH8516075.1 cob(I)yrinic acid a,c-diamide adenosyltransferase [Cyclobacteriaceae bacterium]